MKRSEAMQIRDALDGFVAAVNENPAQVNEHMAAIRPWKEGAHIIGDVRMYDDIPYKCNQSHDSTNNPAWNPKDNPALWSQYHGTTKETARPFIHPTGAHDMYLKGEYAIFADGSIKRANQDTAYSPDEYTQAWEAVE